MEVFAWFKKFLLKTESGVQNRIFYSIVRLFWRVLVNYLQAVTLLSSIIFTSFFSGPALSAGITKCVHPDGRTEFSDKPCPSSSESSTVRPLPVIGRSREKTQQIVSQKNEPPLNRNAQVTPPLSDVSNQAKSAYAAWHQALVRNDFVAFKKLQVWVGRIGRVGNDPSESNAELKRTFDELVKNVPQTFKLSEYKPPTDNTVFLMVIGCKNNIRVSGAAAVRKLDGSWKVDSTDLRPGRVEAEPADLPCAYEAGPPPEETAPVNKSGPLVNGLSSEDRLKSCEPHVAIAAAEEIVGHPASLKEPMGLFSPAFAFFQNGKKNEGVFWFYAAQLRVRQQMVLGNGDRGQILSIMLMTMGPIINNYAFQDTSNLNRILDRVLEWDRKTANPFREKARAQKLDKQIDQVYAGFNELKSKIAIEKTSMEAAARQAAPEIEQMRAQMNSQRCRAGQPDPAYENQRKKVEEQQALNYITHNDQMIKWVGGPVHTSLSSSTVYSHDRNKGRYDFSVGGPKKIFAIVDVDRSSGKPEFKLSCVTTLSLGQREAGKDACSQSTIPLPK